MEKYEKKSEKLSNDLPVVQEVTNSIWRKVNELKELKTEISAWYKRWYKGGPENNRQLVFFLMQEDNTISISDIVEILKLNRSAVLKHIENLKKENLIKRDGA